MKKIRILRRAVSFISVLLLALPIFADQRKAQSRVSPIYPSLAKQMHVSGAVKLICTIDPKGKVISARAISGHPLLVAAAEDAVKQWKFEPADTETETTIEVDFEMTW